MGNHEKAILWTSTLSLGAWASQLLAATTITASFIPTPPVFEQPLSVRLADSQGPHCWPPASSITQDAGVVTLSLTFSDYCSKTNIVPYRDYALGSFEAGSYLLLYKSCSDNPPPLPSACNTVLQVPFVVAAPPPPPVPALSRWGVLGLIAGVLSILGAVMLRSAGRDRRRR